ncbi:hypothetical protein JY651_16570 [Pyxidicoccus parkwayensis]|uniref:Outer membrane protein beta-barrel domain-containing protein n=1 Tax=Pyxidicoccus parkwayensis TaxID=2813578 RepID=A0ABX7P7L1_9BACT|nr:hypothetical protein [Pyxidicoccus parkwaysis]QSQ26441.1 hypothetical protein JY651_16570 [Pyxidicoccus parkwaysis]
MKKALLIPVLLLVATTRAEAVEPLSPYPSQGERPAHALWVVPMVHGSLLVMGPVMGGVLHLGLPVGMNMQLSERTDLVLQVEPMYTRARCDENRGRCGTVRALKVSTGVAWTPWPQARGDGFFLQPRVDGMWSHEDDRPEYEAGAVANRSTTGGQLTLGLDLGYRKTAPRNRGYLAVAVGAGVGYSWNQRRKEIDLGAQYGMPWGDEERTGRILDINMDFLRVGFSF